MAIKFTNDVPTTVQDFPKNEIKKHPKKKTGCFTYFLLLMIITIIYRYSENSVDNNNLEKLTSVSVEDCDKATHFGTQTFCLPNIENYQDISTDSLFTFQRDNLGYEKLLGYYINLDSYQNFVQNGTFYPDDIFKVYSLKILENRDFIPEEFLTFRDEYKKQYSTEWATTEKFSEAITQLNFDKPVLIKEYSFDKDINEKTFVSLVRAVDGNEEVITININNIILLKNKILYASYLTLYENNEDIDKAMQKNDFFMQRFIEINK